MKHTFLELLGWDYTNPSRGMVHWCGGGDDSSSSSDSGDDGGSDDSPGFFDDGGAFESFFDDIGLDVDGDAADGVSGGVANLGDTDGDGRGEFAFTDNASDEDRNNVASGDVGTAGTITNVQDNIVSGVTVNTSGDDAGTITHDNTGTDVTDIVSSGTLIDLSGVDFDYLAALSGAYGGEQVTADELRQQWIEDLGYEVQPGDTLSDIAEDLDTSVGELMDANPDITNPNEIVAGDTINISGVETGVDTYEGMDQQFFPDDDPVVEEEYGEDYTPTAEELAAQLEEAGLESVITDPLSVEEQVQQYEDAGLLDEFELADGTTTSAIDLVDTYHQLQDDVSAYDAMENLQESGALDDTILGTGEGGLQDQYEFRLGDPMDRTLAADLGLLDIYQEGDVILPEDLVRMAELGIPVNQEDLASIDLVGGTADVATGSDPSFTGTGTVDEVSAGVEPTNTISFEPEAVDVIQFVVDSTPGSGATIDPARLSDLESYVAELRSIQGSYSVEDLDAAGFTANEIAAYGQLIDQGGLTAEDIAAMQEKYGALTLPQYNALEETFGSYLGTMIRGSAGLTTEMAGNFLNVLGDIPGLSIEDGKITLDPQDNFLTQTGENVVVTGQDIQENFLELLETRYPEEYVAFNTPILNTETGEFNGDALRAKALYSAIPTLIGLSGIPFGAVPAAVTGALATAAEIGTEARNEAYDQAKEQGFDDEEAEAIGRSANFLGATLGVPVGAASNLILGKLITPGVGASQILNMTGAIVLAGVDEGIIEQSSIKTAANSMFEGEQGFGELDLGFGTLDVSGGFSMDETILGALTGGVISVGAYAKAKARGMTDQEISQQIQNTSNGQTVTLKDPNGAIIEQGSVPVSDVIFSGNPIEMRTDADGNTSIVDTVTGESATMPSGTTFTAGEITGGETTVQELTASEILQGDNISIGQDANGNLTLTDNDTGLTTNIEGDLYYDAFGNMYESAEEAQAADALFGLTGTETTVSDLQATEDSVIGGMGTDVTVKTAGENIELTNEETGLKVSIPLTSDVNIVDIVSSVQDNNISGVADSGGTVVSIGTGTTTITSEEVQNIVDGALAGLSDTATSEDVSTAINEALAGLTDLNADDVKEVIDTALGDLDMLGSEDVETVITDALADLENISAEDVESIVSDALSGLQDVSITDIETAISDALAELPETASPDDVTTAINDALAEMENLSSDDVETVVSEALADLENLSSDDVTTIVSDALAELENVSAEDIETIVADALAELPDYATPDDVSTAINDAIGELENISSEDVETIVGDALSEMENLSTEDVQSIVDSATESIEAGVTEDIGALETALTEKIDALEEAGVDRAEAVDTALTELSDEIGTTKDSLLETIGTTETNLVTQLETVESNITEGLTELSESIDTSNLTLSEMLAIMEEEKRKEEEYLASLEGEPELDRDPTYDPVIADPTIVAQPVPEGEVREGIAAAGIRPTVAPYYQPMQTGEYSFYRPEPGVTQATPAPVFQDPIRYLAPTSDPLYGYGYIAPNMDIARLTRLAAMQDTGAEQLASEDLMNE